jgi:hypothetical protein
MYEMKWARTCKSAVLQKNEIVDRLEFYMDACERLRKQYEPETEFKFDDWNMRRLTKLAQLQALNAELERMLAELELERRNDAKSNRQLHSRHAKCVPPWVLYTHRELPAERFYCTGLFNGRVCWTQANAWCRLI